MVTFDIRDFHLRFAAITGSFYQLHLNRLLKMATVMATLAIRTKLDMICVSKLIRNVVQNLIGIKMQFNKSDRILSVEVFDRVVRSVCYDNLDNSVHTAIFIK